MWASAGGVSGISEFFFLRKLGELFRTSCPCAPLPPLLTLIRRGAGLFFGGGCKGALFTGIFYAWSVCRFLMYDLGEKRSTSFFELKFFCGYFKIHDYELVTYSEASLSMEKIHPPGVIHHLEIVWSISWINLSITGRELYTISHLEFRVCLYTGEICMKLYLSEYSTNES